MGNASSQLLVKTGAPNKVLTTSCRMLRCAESRWYIRNLQIFVFLNIKRWQLFSTWRRVRAVCIQSCWAGIERVFRCHRQLFHLVSPIMTSAHIQNSDRMYIILQNESRTWKSLADSSTSSTSSWLEAIRHRLRGAMTDGYWSLAGYDSISKDSPKVLGPYLAAEGEESRIVDGREMEDEAKGKQKRLCTCNHRIAP